MKYKISQRQLDILNRNFILIEGGLSPINGNIIKESTMREYLVSMWISSYPFELRVGTHGGIGMAMQICRRLFKNARIISAKSA